MLALLVIFPLACMVVLLTRELPETVALLVIFPLDCMVELLTRELPVIVLLAEMLPELFIVPLFTTAAFTFPLLVILFELMLLLVTLPV